MVEGHIAAVGDDAVDELDFARLQGNGAIALIQYAEHGFRELRNLLVEDIVFVNRDDPEPPARATEILRIRVHADRVLRQFAEQRPEVLDEGSVHVVCQEHQVGTLRLHQIRELADRLRAERHARRIARIDDEERLDLRILQLLISSSVN